MLWESAAAFIVLLGSAFLGWRVQGLLPTHHRSRDTVEAVRMVMTMLLTISAVVLGLLTSSAKSRYDNQTSDLESFSTSLIQLDQRLRQYGPDAAPIRAALRAYTAAAIADTWPAEPRPSGNFAVVRHVERDIGFESFALGDLLTEIDRMIQDLKPADEFHRRTVDRLEARLVETLRERWQLLASAHSTLSWPFLAVLMFWLVIIFAIFGLSSPANALVYVVVVLCALSISSSLFLILDFDSPQAGMIRMSSRAMRNALVHMDRP